MTTPEAPQIPQLIEDTLNSTLITNLIENVIREHQPPNSNRALQSYLREKLTKLVKATITLSAEQLDEIAANKDTSTASYHYYFHHIRLTPEVQAIYNTIYSPKLHKAEVFVGSFNNLGIRALEKAACLKHDIPTKREKAEKHAADRQAALQAAITNRNSLIVSSIEKALNKPY